MKFLQMVSLSALDDAEIHLNGDQTTDDTVGHFKLVFQTIFY